MKKPALLLLLFSGFSAMAQYAPQAGLPGSTAISAASSMFTGWATSCTLQRGYMDIANKGLGYASSGDSSMAIGEPDGGIVSLGDSGVATLTFPHLLYNGPGPDFAVFENGFRNPDDSAQAFLELAFVEVSSDGENFFRFPCNSNTPLNTQIPMAGVYMDASRINNLAGKYIAMYGTPFDLQELAGIPGLDVNRITHVRLVDVVGSVGGNCTYDNAGNKINDPYPTAIPTGGFDLDAVGAINMMQVGVNDMKANAGTLVYPNPASDKVTIAGDGAGYSVTITSVAGSILQQIYAAQGAQTIDISGYAAGLYFLTIEDNNGYKWVEKLLKH